jgi:DNA-binding NarL/FixJ family response regulator
MLFSGRVQEVKTVIKVYIVDDHPLVREGLKTFLGTQSEIEICGEAGDGKTALNQMIELQPDAVILDLHLPGMDGIELTKAIKKTGLFTQIIILSSFCEDDEVMAALEAGALSYLMKDSSPQKLIEAITAAKNGEPVLHPRIAKKLIQRVNRPKESLLEPLTAKEKEVLAKLVKGRSNKEIAHELAISDTTVKTHVSSVLHKLGVNDRTQAVIKAIELRLV